MTIEAIIARFGVAAIFAGAAVEGEAAVVADSPWGGLGLTICYDLRFPHLHRALAQAGVTLIARPARSAPTGRARARIIILHSPLNIQNNPLDHFSRDGSRRLNAKTAELTIAHLSGNRSLERNARLGRLRGCGLR